MQNRNNGPLVLFLLLAACSSADPDPNRAATCRATDGALRWYAAERDRAKLDAWCATVATPAIDTLGDSTVAASPDSVIVVAWNVHAGGGNLERFVNDLRDGRLTSGQPVRHFVLLIQEALRVATMPAVDPDEVPDRIVHNDTVDGEPTDFVRIAEALGLAYVYVPSMRNGAGPEDRGNAILSMLPLHQPFAIELPIVRQRRVSVGASIEVADTSIVIVSVHLENFGVDLLVSFGSGRLRQAAALMEVLPRDAPAIVGGDLNTWFLTSGEPVLPFMRRHFPRSPGAVTGATHRGYGRTTDHIFFRLPAGWRVTYRRIDDAYGSDHHPVLGLIWRE